MANILTNLIPNLYEGLDVVSRELVGFIPSVQRNSKVERAALGQEVLVPVSVAGTAKDVVPGMTVPEPDDFETDTVAVKITNSESVSFGLTGEEYRGLDNGVGANTVLQGNVEQAIRVLCNKIEASIGAEAAKGASRAYGTAGTTPFASDLSDAAQIRKILDDNGAPASGRSLIIDTTAGVNLRKLTQLTNVDNAGTTMTLRQGELLPLFGLSVKESAAISTVDAGSASGVTLTASTKGAKELTLKAATSGSLKAGDYITIAGDSNKYLIAEDATLSTGGKIKIAAPGLLMDAADGSAVTVVGDSARNIAFSQNAIVLATRAPALPGGDDAAVDSMMLTDPRSGLSFEIRVYKGYRKMRVEVACAWGVKTIKPEHVAALLG